MTIDQFIQSAPAQLLAFKYATQHQADTDPSGGFVNDRDELDWWREVAAYMMYVELLDLIPKE